MPTDIIIARSTRRLNGLKRIKTKDSSALRSANVQLKAMLLTGVLLLIIAPTVWSHGGKSHKEFTALQALQKATVLYDQLVAQGKLDTTWETGLVEVVVTPPKSPDRKEFVIRFSRTAQGPRSVYFFLTPDGEYAGSNFSGP
ncbi:MAG: DUF6488 family protein [Desulfobacterales bacterium]